MELGPTEASLLISGIVCLVGVLSYRASAKDRHMSEMKELHLKELETREWRTEMRGSMRQHAEDLSIIKNEQRAMREEVRANAKTIDDLEHRHSEDFRALSGRIDSVDRRVTEVASSVGDLMDVMKNDADQETGGNA